MKFFFTPILILAYLNALSQTNIAVGEKAPDIHITDWIANVPADQDLSRKFIVLEFWATWCGPCIKAVPHMNELQETFDSADLLFLSITDENAEKVNRTLKRVDFQSAVVSDQTRQTHIAFGDGEEGLASLPMTVLIDKDGIVRWIGLPDQLTESVMEGFLAGELEEFNHFDENQSPSISISNITISKGAEKAAAGEKNSEKMEKPDLMTLFQDSDMLYYFEFRKTDDEEKDNFSSIADYGLHFTAANLTKLFSKIWKLEPDKIIVPESMQTNRYYLMYKNAKPEAESMKRLEMEILNVLNLEREIVEKTMSVYQVSVRDTSKLEKAMETRFSSQSDAGDKVIFSGYGISEMIAGINERSEAKFTTEESVDAKYDFIINISSTDAIKKSLTSYGIEIKEAKQTVKLIKLIKKE